MASLRVLSRRGDTRIEWDSRHLEAGDPEALAAVREAERILAEQLAQGATAFKVERGRPAERTEVLDPRVEQTVVVPRVAGG